LAVGGAFIGVEDAGTNFAALWDGSNWTRVGSGSGLSGGRYARSLTIYQDRLIVGGEFTAAGDVAANHIAAWDGRHWEPLGSGVGGSRSTSVDAMTVHDDQLVAAGDFRVAGGLPANNIASWSGASWTSLGPGAPPRTIHALCSYAGDLIAGGSVNSIVDGAPAQYIARWDGSIWSPMGAPMGTGLDGEIRALIVHEGDLIAGGFFVTDRPLARIARWNGSTWDQVGPNLGAGGVRALTIFEGDLIAGGWFASFVVRWDGSSWVPIGGGRSADARKVSPDVYHVVMSLGVYHGELFASGIFPELIARWDGASWVPLGSGINGNGASALLAYQGSLYVAGDHSRAGGRRSPMLARWDRIARVSRPFEEPPPAESEEATSDTANRAGHLSPAVSPNPFQGSVAVSFSLDREQAVRVTVHDVRGRLLATLLNDTLRVGEHRVAWNGRVDGGGQAASGTYFVRVQTSDGIEAKKISLAR
jgi:hypothetical protein